MLPESLSTTPEKPRTNETVLSSTEVQGHFEQLKAAYQRETFPSYETRRNLLDRLLTTCLQRRDDIAAAASKDWGHRCQVDTLLGDVFPTLNSIRYARSHLRSWMRPERRSTGLVFLPGQNRVRYQPLGVVGIIAPWNYPFQLCVEPLVYAIAAGNRVMVKPSEITPHTAALLSDLLGEALGPEWVRVVQGDASTAQAFTALPFDHLLFTGSPRVGKLVMRAAAENLVPVTLELGGKSPALVHPDYPLDKAAASIATGKCFNSGQTCVAPDYVLVQRDQLQALADAIAHCVRRRYPTITDNPDYSAIATDGHFTRLRHLLDDAAKAGATVVELKADGEEPGQQRKIAPTLVTGVTPEMAIMQDEIFGPILPLVPYDSVEEAIAFINARPRPLAFYYFDHSGTRVDMVLKQTISGSAAINECLLQFAQDDIPFGGVGTSGMGAYHGQEGFATFSHKRGVFHQSRMNMMHLQEPPYGSRMERLLKFLLGA